jgi:hypothetical protein
VTTPPFHRRFVASGGELLTVDELRTLPDTRLVALIEARSSLDAERAWEALAIIRGELPAIDGDVVTIP